MPRWLPALLVFAAIAAEPGLTPRQRTEDFDVAWRAIDQDYAYFDRNRPAWRGARDLWRPRAASARSRAEFIAAIEGCLQQLRDDHVSLSERGDRSPRRVPAESDIWASWRQGVAVVEAVRAFGDADVAGLKPGDRLVSIAGARMPPGDDWALRHALAGPRSGILRVEIADGARRRTLAIERGGAPPANGPSAGNGSPLMARRVGDERDIGYLRLRHGLADRHVAQQLESALHRFKDTRALIIDLRDASAAPHAAREATLAILGLFTSRPVQWQLRQHKANPRVGDAVAGRGGSSHAAPILVLVDRWTAGEAEALAAGLVAVAGARLVGTPMAGMRGELKEAKLPHSGLVVRFPAEKTFHVDGTPRELLRPHVEIDLAAPSGGPGDPILYQALKLLAK